MLIYFLGRARERMESIVSAHQIQVKRKKKKTSRDGVTLPYKLLSKLLSSVNTASTTYTAFKVV